MEKIKISHKGAPLPQVLERSFPWGGLVQLPRLSPPRRLAYFSLK